MGIWDSAFQVSPSGAKGLGVVDDEIRALKSRLIERIQREFHFDLADELLQFVPKTGSGKVFVQTDAPTSRPNGDAFTEEDAGRIWIKHEYGGSPSISQPIGTYYLAWVSGTYQWRKEPNMAHIGAVEFTAEGFTNPSGADPYNSGTRPGWVLADGSAIISGLPNPAGWVGTVPNYSDGYVKFGSSPTATGGRDDFTLDVTNLPPHEHELDSASNAVITVSTENASVSLTKEDYSSLAGSGREVPTSADVGNGSYNETRFSHTHDVDLSGTTEENDMGGTMISEAIDLDPTYRTLVAIVRMY